MHNAIQILCVFSIILPVTRKANIKSTYITTTFLQIGLHTTQNSIRMSWYIIYNNRCKARSHNWVCYLADVYTCTCVGVLVLVNSYGEVVNYAAV